MTGPRATTVNIGLTVPAIIVAVIIWIKNNQTEHIFKAIGTALANSENSVELDHGCTSRIYFDNAGDNVTLTSQKPY